MAISATRFNFLDKETNVGIKDFTNLTDNKVYSGISDLSSTDFENIQNNKLLEKMSEGLDNLSDMLMTDEISSNLENALNLAINSILAMDLEQTAKNALAKLKETDNDGLRGFLKDNLKIGKRFLCNNLDFLKLFSLGYSINKNILAGLLFALLLSWLDRICKGFTAEESSLETPLKKVNQATGDFEVKVTTDTAFSQFTSYYSDFLKASEPINLPQSMSASDAVSNVINGNIDVVVENIKESEMSSSDRNNIIQALESQLLNFSWQDQEYKNILKAIGNIKQIPLISSERRYKNIRYEHLPSKLGSYIKNLANVELQPLNFLNLNDVEKGLYLKMATLKESSLSNSQLRSTPTDSFNDFDFNSVLPALTTDESNYLLSKDTVSDSHRTHDLHPTTAVFLEV